MKPTREFAVANDIARAVWPKVDAPEAKKPRRSRKGKFISLTYLNFKKFDRSLKTIAADLRINFGELGPIRTIQDLRSIMLEALKRLRSKNYEAYTVSIWLGEVVEVWVELHPVVIKLQKWATRSYLNMINAKIIFEPTAILCLNGHFKKVTVKKTFGDVMTVRDIRLKYPGQPKGKQFCDCMNLASNSDDQFLGMPMEIKSRGAGKKVREQMANFNERLEACPPGTKLTYMVDGTPGEIDVKDLILVFDKYGRPLDEAAYGRIAVIAGSQPMIKVALDANHVPYIRAKAPMNTDVIRQLFERLLRDTSW